MTQTAYAAFFPAARQSAAALEPQESWWPWRGHRVHVARARRPDAAARVLVVHGAGGHSGAVWPLAALLADRGLDVAAVDLPLYGRTVSPDPNGVRYGDWVDLLVDLVAAERDARPLVLLGASIGGMLAYEVAARSDDVDAVAATCLLDPRDWRARARMTRFGILGVLAGPLTGLTRGPFARTTIPVKWVANLSRMSRNPNLTRLCAGDPRGGGARVPIGFLTSYLGFRHIAPRAASTPMTLVHPAEDAWTPVELSVRVLRRAVASTTLVLLRECGHFPVEEPGLTDLIDTIVSLAADVASPR
ncbi:alpha/beta hydrolase [Brooklawnia cerclae]|uniref:Alpha-beta hydrolase superfamily lysophospholipase n=1 Tax=Brooklawnia cerclae TaxID=349934 RepID=A0ABX0SGT0_9ACTN|nr:alpha-beta hydrolase superfamily lysophospholipase [Brooklawnia cerclae]